MPVFGQLNLKSSVGRFARLLAQMLGTGVPILKSLDVVARALGNRVLEKSVTLARQEVEQCNQLNTALTGKPYMPLILIRMIRRARSRGASRTCSTPSRTPTTRRSRRCSRR